MLWSSHLTLNNIKTMQRVFSGRLIVRQQNLAGFWVRNHTSDQSNDDINVIADNWPQVTSGKRRLVNCLKVANYTPTALVCTVHKVALYQPCWHEDDGTMALAMIFSISINNKMTKISKLTGPWRDLAHSILVLYGYTIFIRQFQRTPNRQTATPKIWHSRAYTESKEHAQKEFLAERLLCE